MKKIVLSRFGGIGDVVMLTPILKGIKKIHPDIVLTLVTDKVSTEFAKKFPFVDNVYYYDKTLYSTIYLIKKLWKSDFVFLIAMLSLAVGMFNLFPIPILDGGYALVYLWEGLTHKLPTEKMLNRAANVGLYILLLLVVYASYSDIKRIFFKPKAAAVATQTQADNGTKSAEAEHVQD